MSLAGKINDLLPGGAAAHPHGHVHIDTVPGHAPADAVVIPDAHLFTGDFKREGVDLIVSKDDDEPVHLPGQCRLLSGEMPEPPTVDQAAYGTGRALYWTKFVDVSADAAPLSLPITAARLPSVADELRLTKVLSMFCAVARVSFGGVPATSASSAAFNVTFSA